MDSIEKKTIKNFLKLNIPKGFLNNIDKDLFDCFFKGHCYTFLGKSYIDNESIEKIISWKNDISKEIDFNNDENVIYFDYMRLVISIMKKIRSKRLKNIVN
jgi:hypothetical protein